MDEIERIYKEASNLINVRNPYYGDGWKRDSLQELYHNVTRKARGIKFLIENGIDTLPTTKENLLDLINYGAMASAKLDMGKEVPISLALDCPTNWLGLIQPLADFDWILADKALKDKTYLNYFVNSQRPKIIDNRRKGTGEPIGLEDIRKVWDKIGGLVVAPDWFGDQMKTLGAYGECAKTFGEENIIGVIQSFNPRKIMECLGTYGKRIAVSYDVGSKNEDPYWVKMCRRSLTIHRLKDREVHLLGFVSLLELDLYRHCSTVVSLNTGVPVWLAFMNRRIEDFQEDKQGDAYNLMNMDSTPIDLNTFRLVEHNIREMREKMGFAQVFTGGVK